MGRHLISLGKGIANPIASIWSGQLLLDHLGEQEAAATLLRAIEEVLQKERYGHPTWVGGRHLGNWASGPHAPANDR